MKTCEEITYERLKERILCNELPQGEFLSQRKLAESVGATLMSLRSSLRLLENDGLIENVPKWGVRIPVESAESIKERYYVRELLEIGAVDQLLILNIPGAKESLMEKAKACDMVRRTDAESFREFAEKHAALHLAIAELCGNRLLFQQLNRLNFRSMMLQNARFCWETYDENTNATYHCNFIEAIFSGDRSEATETVRKHIRTGCRLELKTLEALNQNNS